MTGSNRIIPRLQKLSSPPSEFARTTCFQGGFLVSKNAGWRSERPIIDHDSCTLCLQCYMLCPDGTIYKQRSGDSLRSGDGVSSGDSLRLGDGVSSCDDARTGDDLKSIDIDLDFCKGCGICAKACPASCIEMVSEDAFLDSEMHK